MVLDRSGGLQWRAVTSPGWQVSLSSLTAASGQCAHWTQHPEAGEPGEEPRHGSPGAEQAGEGGGGFLPATWPCVHGAPLCSAGPSSGVWCLCLLWC